MKQGVLPINTARGSLVKESSLIAGSKTGKIIGAGLDVFEREPLPIDSELRSLPNVVLTSHAASVPTRVGGLLQIMAAAAARGILLGRRPEGTLV
jgi:D-3-phosphoglycerate dehydrogenase / 2-oxoglutarate reductase